jgi:hypothetical protein
MSVITMTVDEDSGGTKAAFNELTSRLWNQSRCGANHLISECETSRCTGCQITETSRVTVAMMPLCEHTCSGALVGTLQGT